MNKYGYKIVIRYNDVDFDYYSDIYMYLYLEGEKKVLYRDNCLEFYRIIKKLDNKVVDLCNNLNNENLGMMLNEYYRSILGDQKLTTEIGDDMQCLMDRYCVFESQQCATWLYKHKGKVVLLVTPVFQQFEQDDYFRKYVEFEKKYKDILKLNIKKNELKTIKKRINELMNDIISLIKKSDIRNIIG